MATLAELYEFLETKQDDSHLDSRFSYDAFLPVEQPKARLEILTWWKIERLIEDENCNFDKNFIVSYFDERVKVTNNQLLKYRYNYFISLLTNDNRYAKQSIDALIAVINTLLPKDKEDYPHVAEKAIEVLMSLIKRVKYKIPEATDLIWGVLESDYGYRTKMVCIRLAKEKGFFPSRDAKKIVCLCKDLLSLVKDSWRENCCELGLFYSSKIQGEAKPYMNFFYEALGDMEMGQLVDPATAPNNIAIPWMNEDHSQKAMAFYQKAGLTQKRNRAELAFRENKKKMVMLHFKIEKKTDKKIVEYFGNLEKELLEGKLSWLLENLSCPVRFLFPSYEQIRLRMSASKSTVEKLGFENKIMDINGNSKDAGKDFDLRQKYGIWLMNIVRNTVINMILTAVNIKQLTYSKLRKWFLKNTCFGIQLEYTRSGQVVTTTWFSQIDYGVEALIKQYNRFLQGKPTDWRLPVDILSIRFAASFNETDRKIELDGATYFDVAKNPEKPFVVSAKGYRIRVLGTKFNISAYKNSKEFETDLVEGCVHIYDPADIRNEVFLQPKEKAVLWGDRLMKRESDFDNEEYLKNGVVSFLSEPFGRVLNSVALWNDVNIKIERSVNATQRISGKFRQSDSLESILKALQGAMPFKYKIVSEEEIIIY